MAGPCDRIECRPTLIAGRVSMDAWMGFRVIVVLQSILPALVLMIAGACHTNRSRPVSGSAASTPDQRAQASVQNPKKQRISIEESASTAQIALLGRVVESDAVAVVVANHGATEVRLEGRLEVERYTDEGWKSFGAQDLTLRYSCETKVDKCVALLPGAEIFPPPWQAARGPAQCHSRVGVSAPAGRYRFKAQSCDQTSVVVGEPFQL